MSGGHFGYEEHHIERIAEQVWQLIRENRMPMPGEGSHDEETINKFEIAYELLCKAAIYVHRIDYLVSCDDSDTTFQERLKEDLDEFYKKINESMR